MDWSLLDGVLGVVRDLGGCVGLDDTLRVIADAAVDVLGFGAAAVNVISNEGHLRVDAVAGPAEVRALLGTRRPLNWWLELLEAAEPWGELRFFSHTRDQAVFDQFPSWSPAGPSRSEPDAWHPDDSLLAPMWDERHTLIGVLSVDDPSSGRHPNLEQRGVLEVFAAQAAKAILDAQAREKADADRGELEIRWRLAFQQSPTGAALIGIDGRIVEVNGALAELLGYSAAQLSELTFADVTHPEDLESDLALFDELLAGVRHSYTLEKRYLRRDGSVVHAQLRVGVVRDADGRVQTIVGQVLDLTERRERELLLAHQRTHDVLTGRLNHAGILDELTDQLSLGRSVGVLFCDIDHFKMINNSLGRDVGDQVLILAAARLADVMAPEVGSVARIGNDEFVLLAPPGSDNASLHRLGERLIAGFQRPLQLADGTGHTISISIGVASRDHGHADDLIADAQEAMHRAKQRGRARIEVYDPDLDHAGNLQDLQLDQALRAALSADDQLRVYLQPIVNIADETIVGSEALIRWQHPHRGLLRPSEFLPAAEYSGLIVELGWRMLTLATQAAAGHNHVNNCDTWIAVNVSGNQLGRGRLPTAVREALTMSGLAPHRLHLEFTETALVEATRHALDEIHEIHDMGIAIALDDFGTGYSSLSLLRDLPISAVKIDRSFTTLVAGSRRAAALVRSLVSMCDSLDVMTIAEGIETREQLALIRALGCDQGQGYLFGTPQPATALDARVQPATS